MECLKDRERELLLKEKGTLIVFCFCTEKTVINMEIIALMRKYEKVKFRRLDLTENPGFFIEKKVASVPTYIVFFDSNEVGRISGDVFGFDELEKIIENNQPKSAFSGEAKTVTRISEPLQANQFFAIRDPPSKNTQKSNFYEPRLTLNPKPITIEPIPMGDPKTKAVEPKNTLKPEVFPDQFSQKHVPKTVFVDNKTMSYPEKTPVQPIQKYAQNTSVNGTLSKPDPVIKPTTTERVQTVVKAPVDTEKILFEKYPDIVEDLRLLDIPDKRILYALKHSTNKVFDDVLKVCESVEFSPELWDIKIEEPIVHVETKPAIVIENKGINNNIIDTANALIKEYITPVEKLGNEQPPSPKAPIQRSNSKPIEMDVPIPIPNNDVKPSLTRKKTSCKVQVSFLNRKPETVLMETTDNFYTLLQKINITLNPSMRAYFYILQGSITINEMNFGDSLESRNLSGFIRMEFKYN